MNFYAHTQNWIQGELFESIVIMVFSAALFGVAFAFWKFGTTAGSKALILPLVLMGVIYLGVGANMQMSNQARLKNFPAQHSENPAAFIQSEKKRVEDFQYQYKISKAVTTICFIMTLLIFWFTRNPYWQGAGLGLSLFALAGLVVDYFSEERAHIYYQAILTALKSTS